MLNFQAFRGYPMVHCQLAFSGDRVTYQYTHTEEPCEGEEAVSMKKGSPLVLISVDKVEVPKSRHHTAPVRLYTCTFQILPIQN